MLGHNLHRSGDEIATEVVPNLSNYKSSSSGLYSNSSSPKSIDVGRSITSTSSTVKSSIEPDKSPEIVISILDV